MGMDGDAAWFEAAETSLQAINVRPLRHLRLKQSKLEVLCALQPTAIVEIERLGREGIRLAEQYGYPRHRALILQTLTAALDS